MSLHTWCHQGPHKPSCCASFTLHPHRGRTATGKRSPASGHGGSLRACPTLCDPVACGLPVFCQGGVLRERTLERVGQYCGHALLEPCVSRCPSRQLPWVPGAARAPVAPAAAPPPHLALTGANPSPPGQPQEQTPVDDPDAEVEIKPQLKPRGSVTKKKRQWNATQLKEQTRNTEVQINEEEIGTPEKNLKNNSE